MAYELVTEFGTLGPLACDNPASLYGMNDSKVKRSAEKLCKALEKNGIKAEVRQCG